MPKVVQGGEPGMMQGMSNSHNSMNDASRPSMPSMKEMNAMMNLKPGWNRNSKNGYPESYRSDWVNGAETPVLRPGPSINSPGQTTRTSSTTDFQDFVRSVPPMDPLPKLLGPEGPSDPLARLFDDERPHKYKTEMCKYFQLACCKRGSDCTFAHHVDELRQDAPGFGPHPPSAGRMPPRPEEVRDALLDEGRDGRPKKYKTELCKYWQLGTCKRGRECTFAHSHGELRGSALDDWEDDQVCVIQDAATTPKFSPSLALAPPKKYKTEMCKFFALGTCKRARDCTFAHTPSELRNAADETPRVPPGGTFPEMCKYWAMGSCKRGRECAFAHSRAELGAPYASRAAGEPGVGPWSTRDSGRERGQSDTSSSTAIDILRVSRESPGAGKGLPYAMDRMPSVSMVESEMEACELKGGDGPGFHLPSGVLD